MTTTTTDDGGGSTSFKPFANSNQANDGKDDDNEMDIPLPVQFVGVSLQQLKEKLDAIPYDMKSSLVYAQHYAQLVNAELVNDNHLLGFLYVEKFNIDVSTQCSRHDSPRYAIMFSFSYSFYYELLSACTAEIATVLGESAQVIW